MNGLMQSNLESPPPRQLRLPADDGRELGPRPGVLAPGFVPVRDRMIKSRSAARQRRLYRLACRMRAGTRAGARREVDCH